VLLTGGEEMPRWLLVFGTVALIALIAGFVTFGVGDMGPNDFG
jgi:hypothetical protein